MSGFPRNLQTKLILALIVLIAANSIFFATVTIVTTRKYMQAVEQSVNRSLAERILTERWLPEPNDGSTPMVFDRLMSVDPDIWTRAA